MNRNQIWVIAGAIILFLILYLGFEITPPKQKSLEKSRALNIEATSVNNLIQEANLDADKKSMIDAINLDLQKANSDSIKKLGLLKSLSGTWYDLGYPSIAGYYAEEAADIIGTDASWAIAGTTYSICTKNAKEDKTKQFCSKRAVKAFEKAISIAPEVVDHRINLANCYIDNPNPETPMQGILMLKDLNTKYPKSVAVLNQLGKLALQTNQSERALERLEAAILLEPENNVTICLLVDAYTQLGNNAKASEYKKKCVN